MDVWMCGMKPSACVVLDPAQQWIAWYFLLVPYIVCVRARVLLNRQSKSRYGARIGRARADTGPE